MQDLLSTKQSSQARGHRTSVSAEAFGNWNKKKEFAPPKYEKTPE